MMGLLIYLQNSVGVIFYQINNILFSIISLLLNLSANINKVSNALLYWYWRLKEQSSYFKRNIESIS